jgi:hypothetical protein
VPRLIRRVAYLLLAAGIAALAASLVTEEGVNQSGFVPGVGVGYTLVTMAGLAFLAARHLRIRDYLRLAVDLVLALWVAGSVYLVIWGLRPGSLAHLPMGSMLAVIIFFGFIGAEIGAVFLLFLLPIFLVLAWIADQIPALRRRGVGTQIRRAMFSGWIVGPDSERR